MNLKVITYNIHRAIGVDRRFRPERIVEILESYEADIIALQEVDDGVPRSRELNLAKELAEALDFPYYVLGKNVSLKKGHYGNATLSRFPIVRERNIDLTIANKKRRGCQHTTIDIPCSPHKTVHLEVFNLHLGLSAKERDKQIQKLLNSSEYKNLNEDSNKLIIGDFNDWRSLLRKPMTGDAGFLCATDRCYRNKISALKTYPSFSPRGGLDRVFYQGDLKLENVFLCRKKLSKVASDHKPVITEFKL